MDQFTVFHVVKCNWNSAHSLKNKAGLSRSLLIKSTPFESFHTVLLIRWFSRFDHRVSHLISGPRPKCRFFRFLVAWQICKAFLLFRTASANS
jgi:hypothetical protein